MLCHSGKGFGGLSANMHAFVTDHVIPPHWRGRPRPVLYNSWEGCTFDFTQRRLLSLANRAKALGCELFVLDDGWFAGRDNDRAGLGDYTVNRKKLPEGLEGLSRHLKDKGLSFGLWFEPESVNPDSDLYRAHPDWALTDGFQPVLGRNQLLLDLTKPEVREIAKEQGFVNARKRDSQDICFVPNGDYADFIERRTGKKCPEGNFIDRDGHILGKHRGIIRYTIGQRKGLGLSLPEPMYVCAVNPADNTVVLGKEAELYTRTLTAKDINLISVSCIEKPLRVKAKIRYRQAEQQASVTQTDADTLKIEFDAPQRAATKGQSVVLYDGDTVVGGGTIE